MICLSPLKRGDLVDVIAPGSACTLKEVSAALGVLEKWGLRARLPKDSIKTFLYHSHSDERRLELLTNALQAEDSKAIWCLRGGYGSNRLMQDLQKMKKPKTAKIFVGLSDVTSLHLFLNQVWQWPTLHGPVLVRLGSGDLGLRGKKEIQSLVFGKMQELEFSGVKPLNAEALQVKSRGGALKAEFLGGNLMTLQSAIGTKVALQGKQHFVFIEEVAERGYRIDRMLYHLFDAGCFQGARGIFLGEFLGGDEPLKSDASGGARGSRSTKSYVKKALQRFIKDIGIPVFGYLPVGHGFPQRTLPFGTAAVWKDSLLKVESGIGALK